VARVLKLLNELQTRWKPPAVDLWVLGLLAGGFLLLFVPTYYELAHTIWATDEQGHGPIILAVSGWLMFGLRKQLAELNPRPVVIPGWALLIVALALYAFGSSQQIIMFQTGSQILLLAALLLLFLGWAGLRTAWFPLFFMIFMIPWPEALVAVVTGPLKIAVSAVASSVLYNVGFPVGRSGVVLTVGQYQLLVADACAGLNSMFTLEALGMLYMRLMNYTHFARNVSLALLLIPISFVANVIRVIILILVTYYFGDEAGQGFVHGFAGMVLFLSALVIMMVADRALGFVFGVQTGSVVAGRAT